MGLDCVYVCVYVRLHLRLHKPGTGMSYIYVYHHSSCNLAMKILIYILISARPLPALALFERNGRCDALAQNGMGSRKRGRRVCIPGHRSRQTADEQVRKCEERVGHRGFSRPTGASGLKGFLRGRACALSVSEQARRPTRRPSPD